MAQNKPSTVISEEEFLALQSTLLQIKQEKYEVAEKEQRVSKELAKFRQLYSDTEQQLKKANGTWKYIKINLNFSDFQFRSIDLISKSKDAKAIQLLSENENMKRLVDQTRVEAKEQQEVRSLILIPLISH